MRRRSRKIPVQPVVTMLIQGVSAMIPLLIIPGAAKNLLYHTLVETPCICMAVSASSGCFDSEPRLPARLCAQHDTG
jgi:hypothetical protein